MSDLHYTPLGDGIYCIETGLYRHGLAACYLIREGDRVAFVDTRTTHTVPRLLAILAELGLWAASVDYVIPTHVHLDHAGGSGELMRHCPNATLVTHPKGTPHLIEPSRLATCEYEAQLRETAALAAFPLGRPQWSLVYRGRPCVPRLEPDIVDHLRALAAEGVRDVVAVPIGSTSQDVEVRYDLDLEARSRALELGLNMVRAATPGTHPRFVRMICELAEERLSDAPVRLHLGARGPAPDVCPPDCCPGGRG